jgi:palmitoyl-protein thioesterase
MKSVPEFASGVNVVGLSQGGLIARAMAEMCNVTVHNVITMGGPHMGVMSIPNCETGFFCDIFNDIVDIGIYDTFVQENAGPPGYFKDPLIYDEYLQKSEFLAAANNEKIANQAFSDGFKKINQLVLVEFTEDTVVDPKESEWFGYFKIGSKTELQNYNETADYTFDILGLKTLDQQGKIVFESIVGNHLQFNTSEIDRTVIPYLR